MRYRLTIELIYEVKCPSIPMHVICIDEAACASQGKVMHPTTAALFAGSIFKRVDRSMPLDTQAAAAGPQAQVLWGGSFGPG